MSRIDNLNLARYTQNVKAYINERLVGKTDYLGTISSISNLSTTCGKGDFYRVETQFEFGTEVAHVGDILIALKDNPSQNISDWDLIHTELNKDTWVANTAEAAGYVAKGEGSPNKVWATDVDGNPAWRDEINSNLINGEGSGSLQQTGYTQESIYEDFRYYAAAYAIATTQTTDVTTDIVENVMNMYDYNTLITMVAEGMFEGSVESAETYLDGMIAEELADYLIVENDVKSSVSTALGIGNIINSPVSFAVGAYNILGRKGHPQASIGAFAAGINNSVNGKCSAVFGFKNTNNSHCSIVVGSELINNGNCSIVGGYKNSMSPSQWETDVDKANVREFFDNLKYHGLVSSYTDESTWEFNGNHSDESNICFNGYIGENALHNNTVIGGSVVVKGGANTVLGHNNVVGGYRNFINGQTNNLYSATTDPSFVEACVDNVVVGGNNSLGSEYGVYGSWRNLLVGEHIDATNSRYNNIQGYNIQVGIKNPDVPNDGQVYCSHIQGANISASNVTHSIVFGENLVAKNRDYSLILGKNNRDNQDAIIEVGYGELNQQKNIFEVLKNGTVKGGRATASADDELVLVTKGYVDALEARLAALEEKLANAATAEDISTIFNKEA